CVCQKCGCLLGAARRTKYNVIEFHERYPPFDFISPMCQDKSLCVIENPWVYPGLYLLLFHNSLMCFSGISLAFSLRTGKMIGVTNETPISSTVYHPIDVMSIFTTNANQD